MLGGQDFADYHHRHCGQGFRGFGDAGRLSPGPLGPTNPDNQNHLMPEHVPL